jgi:hypothetical protein
MRALSFSGLCRTCRQVPVRLHATHKDAPHRALSDPLQGALIAWSDDGFSFDPEFAAHLQPLDAEIRKYHQANASPSGTACVVKGAHSCPEAPLGRAKAHHSYGCQQ